MAGWYDEVDYYDYATGPGANGLGRGGQLKMGKNGLFLAEDRLVPKG